ncbi:putative TonB-dependent outer membrane receptor [Flavobacterium psychrophilum]|uniref:TonB-dependent receptor n=1 Tax=Flavobacterium psychrophilum TaxID=96345 RepID=UPI00073F5FFA|nr:TonB-dependent receptor [Flavobacterium psychrophilum]EKT3958200.1 TonB-dependent receptor [Flavobacterium psychrophilum]ELI6455973.1 TonB-dependent receptor [Flavobacterium psychrophilum]ELV7525451.1 TonB-dependent receptor [Flavobacterium psychrophilum]MCB6062448.1 TonB-dependent receptor [Flavobacterium psychrophilum]SNB04032.1 putative TonB-dependent outer membrane receptor [Flavobacterium psychrophilum]
MITKKILTLLVFLLVFATNFAQDRFTISGIISDAKNNETLIGVNISSKNTKAFAVTNEYGFYSLTLPKGDYQIAISYVGFQKIEETISLTQNIKKNYSLLDSEQQLEEVVITEKTKSNIRKPEMSVNKLSIATIKQMPVVLGEVDVLKAILLLPGVTNAGEGQSGFNVRGGGADQNLILLDEATIFNSSHVFGFFSVFNPDAIKDLKLYKGGIPARFGGRASSVLDIYQKDGNSKNFHVNGGIGLISSRLLAEGPIVKDKGSFLIGGRASYAHLFLKLTDNKNVAYFYDLNTKLNYKLNKNNNLYVSGYFGRDVFSLNKTFTNTYGNSTLNLRWNHLYSDKLFSNLSMIYSDYYYGLTLDFVGFNWNSGIKNYNLKYDFKYYLSDKIKLNYGANGIYYNFNPGTIEPVNSQSGINYKQLEKKYAFEPALYIDAEQKITNNLSVNYGLRYSMFYRLGNSTVNLYENNQPVFYDSDLKIYEKAKPIGTEYFGKNKTIASFNNLEPRFSVAYELNNNQSVKASYNRMVQYLQLISNTASPTPLDVWTPSDNYIKPQIADQVAIGYFNNFSDDKYSVEIESFYKKIQNRIDYIDGADLIANEAIEQVILNGRMRSYGLEFMIRKNTGKLNGWIAYTISKSQQQTPGRTLNEVGINNGDWYRSAYDKLHNLAVTSTYNLNKKWTFGANFTLQTGQPVTYPNGQYVYQGITIPSYELRNKNSLPTYHHLDISATYTPKPDKKKGRQSEWVFSIYNIYARKNAASISFRQNADSGNTEAIKLSIFGIVPSVSYNFKF